jgi:ketosteroid isomerase-like protein
MPPHPLGGGAGPDGAVDCGTVINPDTVRAQIQSAIILRSFGDHVLVELSHNGTHKGDLVIPPGTISATRKQIHAPCCDVFHLKDGKVFSFHCYVAVPILLEQLGVFMNLQVALRH